MSQEQERYLIIFNFGSFIYMFFIIGIAVGFLIGVIDGVWNIAQACTLSSVGWALSGLVTTPFGFGLTTAFIGILGFFPYRWLCKRGWGWPTKGVFESHRVSWRLFHLSQAAMA